MPYRFENPEFYGVAVEYYWINPSGEATLIHTGVVSPYGDVSLVLGPGNYPANPDYGTYSTENGPIEVWGRFWAVVNGVVVQDVVVKAGGPEAVSYILAVDEVNADQRVPSTWYWAWK